MQLRYFSVPARTTRAVHLGTTPEFPSAACRAQEAHPRRREAIPLAAFLVLAARRLQGEPSPRVARSPEAEPKQRAARVLLGEPSQPAAKSAPGEPSRQVARRAWRARARPQQPPRHVRRPIFRASTKIARAPVARRPRVGQTELGASIRLRAAQSHVAISGSSVRRHANRASTAESRTRALRMPCARRAPVGRGQSPTRA